MLKRFSLLLLIMLTGCNQTSTIVNTIPNSTPTPLISVAPSSPNPVSSNSPSQPLNPSPIPSVNQSTTVKSIHAFPNYLVLKEGETKNIYSQVKMINGSFNKNFTITSFDESIAKIENNTLIALREGLTSINVISKDDTTKNFVIPVEVQDNLFTYRLKTPEKENNSFNPVMKKFDLDRDNLLSMQYYKDNKISYSYNSELNLGYKNWQEANNNLASYEIEKNNTAFSKNSKFISRKDKITRYENNKEIATYNLYVDIFENDNLKKTIKINDTPFSRDETLIFDDNPLTDDGNNIQSFYEIFKSVISNDDNGNFTIVWNNQFYEYRARSFNKEGEPVTPVTIIDTVLDRYNIYFNLDVSPNGEKIIFSKSLNNYAQSNLYIKVFNNQLKKLYENNIEEISGLNSFIALYKSLVSINDLGEYIVAWYTTYDGLKSGITLKKYNINYPDILEYSFEFNQRSSDVLGLSINNNSSIVLGFLYYNVDPNSTLGMRYFPGDKNKEYINLKRGQTYKLDSKYSKYVSSNDSVVNIKDSELIAQDLGTATINGFDENDYEKNITLKVNVSL